MILLKIAGVIPEGASLVVEKVEQLLKKKIVFNTFEVEQFADDLTRFTIQTTSDKLEHLWNYLCQTGVEVNEQVYQTLCNAAEQYSVYRDISIQLDVTKG